MAQRAKATPESVDAAIRALLLRGEEPTLKAVRGIIGGGSMASLQPLVRAWKERQRLQSEAEAELESPPQNTGPASLPTAVAQALEAAGRMLETIGDSVSQAINGAVTDERHRGRLELASELNVFERRLAEANEKIRTAEQETAEVVDDASMVESALDAARDQLDRISAEREQAVAELVDERAQRESAQATTDRLVGEIAALREAIVRADARAAAAEDRARVAETGRAEAEARMDQAEQARRDADADRRRALDQARIDLNSAREVSACLSAERDELREQLATERESGAAAESEMAKRIEELVDAQNKIANRLETALAQAAELRGRRDAATLSQRSHVEGKKRTARKPRVPQR